MSINVDPQQSIEHHLGDAVYSLEAAVSALDGLAQHANLTDDYDRLSEAHTQLGNLLERLGRCL